MRQRGVFGMAIVLAIVCSIGWEAGAQHRPPEHGGGFPRELIMDVLHKAREGHPLNEKEQAILERVRAEAEEQAQRGNNRLRQLLAEFGLHSGGLPIRIEMNVIDAAYYQIAEIHMEEEQHEEAAEQLAIIVAKSPVEEAVSAAHLNLAHLYRKHLQAPDKAIQEYRLVKGELRGRAIHELVNTYEEQDQWEEAAKSLEELLTETEDKHAKVGLLQMLAELCRRHGESEKAIAALRRIPETLTYEEALHMQRGGEDAEALKREIHELHRVGRHEEAERLERRLREIMHERRRPR